MDKEYYKGLDKATHELIEKFLFAPRDMTDKSAYNWEMMASWDTIDQVDVNSLLKEIATISGSLEGQKVNEARNIKDDLVIVDSVTGQKIELVDTESMKRRIDTVLDQSDLFSTLTALAMTNKCAHIFANKCDDLTRKINDYTQMLANDPTPQIPKTIEYDITELPEEEINKILNTLDGSYTNRGVAISMARKLKIPDEKIKKMQRSDDEARDFFNEAKRNKKNIIADYINMLNFELQKNEDYRKDMFWTKDQLIIMVGQLLTKDPRFSNMRHELVHCGEPGFDTMLAVDYPELSYYIEVHMPNYVANTLTRDFGMGPRVASNHRMFEPLGASAIYKREQSEVNNIASNGMSNTRRRIIGRNTGVNFGTGGASYFHFVYERKHGPGTEGISIIEEFFRKRGEFNNKIIEFSKTRSDQGDSNHEQKIVASAIITATDEVATDTNMYSDFREFALKKLARGSTFDKVFYMYAMRGTPEEFIRCVAFEKEIKREFKKDTIQNKERRKDKLVMFNYIAESVKKHNEQIEPFIEQLRKKKQAIDESGIVKKYLETPYVDGNKIKSTLEINDSVSKSILSRYSDNKNRGKKHKPESEGNDDKISGGIQGKDDEKDER